VLIALEQKEVETSPRSGSLQRELIDLTTVYDDQDVMHTDPQTVKSQVINTRSAGDLQRLAPQGDAHVNGLLRKKGLQQLVHTATPLRLETTVRMLDAIKDLGFSYATRAGSPSGSTTSSSPTSRRRWWGAPRRR